MARHADAQTEAGRITSGRGATVRIPPVSGNPETLASILIGIFVGLFCGIFGVGGGITILVVLVFVLNYPIKIAIGTSVLIMAFISLSGGVGHFIGKPLPIMELVIASVGGIFGAGIAARYANKISEEKMFKISGIILILISIAVIFGKFFSMAHLFLM